MLRSLFKTAPYYCSTCSKQLSGICYKRVCRFSDIQSPSGYPTAISGIWPDIRQPSPVSGLISDSHLWYLAGIKTAISGSRLDIRQKSPVSGWISDRNLRYPAGYQTAISGIRLDIRQPCPVSGWIMDNKSRII